MSTSVVSAATARCRTLGSRTPLASVVGAVCIFGLVSAALAQVDVGVLRVVSPPALIDSGTLVIPSAWLRNYDSDSAVCSATMKIGAFYTNTHAVVEMAPGESLLLNFAPWTAIQRGTHAVRCSTYLSGDTNPANDTASSSVHVRVQDVEAVRVVWPTGTIDSGTAVTPQARVRNRGTVAATFNVTFRIGSFYTNTRAVTSLGPGDSTVVSFTNWTATQRGTHATRCSTYLSGDRDRSNDVTANSVTVQVLDAMTIFILAPAGIVDSGSVVTPQARVRNNGTDPATFNVTLRIGSFYANTQTVVGLGVGAWQDVSFTNWTAGQMGTHAVVCTTALAGDLVPANDRVSSTVTVGVTDVAVRNILAPAGTYDSGAVVTPQARVRNNGTLTTTFTVGFRIGAFYSNTQIVNNLAPGESTLVSFTAWTAAQRGTHAARCSVYAALDRRPGNDTLGGTVAVRVTDVTARAILAPTGILGQDTVITPQARVRNNGTQAASFSVNFRIGSFYSRNQNVNSLAAGDSLLLSFNNWTATQLGTHTVVCTTSLTGDQNPANNRVLGSVTVLRANDVGPLLIVAPTGTVDSGAVVPVSAWVRNFGLNPAANFPVTLRIGSFYTDTRTVAGLGSGESTLVNFTDWTATQVGSHVTRCSTNLSGDQNPANDVITSTVLVRVTDVTVMRIVAPIGVLDSGVPVTPQARVRNQGSQTATFTATFRIGTGYTNTRVVSNLAPGDSALVSFTNWTPAARGLHATRCSTFISGDQYPANDTVSDSTWIRVVDVQTVRIMAPLGTIDSGAVVMPHALVRNNGSIVASFPVSFRIGSFYADTVTVSNLAVGDSAVVTFASWNAVQRGGHLTECVSTLPGDIVPGNDTVRSVVVVQVVDVEAVAIVAPPAYVDSGWSVTPAARVRNRGSTPASFPVYFEIGSVYLDTANVASLPPGDSVTVQFGPWLPVTVGSYALRCSTAMPGDVTPENDTRSGSCRVRVRDVATLAILAPTGVLDSGVPMTPVVRVANLGTETETFMVHCFIGGSYVQSRSKTLPSGGADTVAMPIWTPAVRGRQLVRCSTAISYDVDNSNNTKLDSCRIRILDVGVTEISGVPAEVDSGEIVRPTVTVHNWGTDAAVVPVWFHFHAADGDGSGPDGPSDGELDQVYSDSISVTVLPGTNAVGNFVPWTAVTGSYLSESYTVLPGDIITSNDSAHGSIVVQGPVRDVGIVLIVWPRGSRPIGDPAVPAATWHNYGSFPVDFEAWAILESDVGGRMYAEKIDVVGLVPGRDTTIRSFPACTLGLLGNWTVRCSTVMAYDQNPENDVRDGSFAVLAEWKEITSVPANPSGRPVKRGAWLAYNEGDGMIYAQKGNKTTDFYRYDTEGNYWMLLSGMPYSFHPTWNTRPPDKGSRGAADGGNYLYITQGNNTLGFWRYDIAGDTWTVLGDVPLGPRGKKVKGGTDLVHVPDAGGRAYVYMLKGYKTEFYRYDVAAATWEQLENAPDGRRAKYDRGSWAVYDGDQSIYVHKSKYHELYRYDIPSARWDDTLDLPGMPYQGSSGRRRKSKDGAGAVWMMGSVFALKGGNTQEFWRYDPVNNVWTEMDTIPAYGSTSKRKKVKYGGDLAAAGVGLYALKGNKTLEFWRYRLEPGAFAAQPRPRPRRDGVASEVPVKTGRIGLRLQPNPLVDRVLNVSYALPRAEAARIVVYDPTGRAVGQRALAATRTGTATLDLGGLSAGVYLVRLESGTFIESRKLVVE